MTGNRHYDGNQYCLVMLSRQESMHASDILNIHAATSVYGFKISNESLIFRNRRAPCGPNPVNPVI